MRVMMMMDYGANMIDGWWVGVCCKDDAMYDVHITVFWDASSSIAIQERRKPMCERYDEHDIEGMYIRQDERRTGSPTLCCLRQLRRLGLRMASTTLRR